MITLSVNTDGDIQVRQSDASPTVYLDHWALGEISEDKHLTDRFVAALEARQGTLAFSWVNLVEFSKVKSEGRARKTEEFIEANLYRMFFLEADPFVVIDREDKLLAGGAPAPPHADDAFLKEFVIRGSKSVKPFTAHDLFQGKGGLAQDTDRLADTFIERVEMLRGEIETNLEIRSMVRRPARAAQIQRGTRDILRELLRSLMVDKQTRITRNHAIDFYHAVVSIAYCDLVLLDKYWETQVDRVRSRFEHANMSVPMAKVFSKKMDGIERFMHALESG